MELLFIGKRLCTQSTLYHLWLVRLRISWEGYKALNKSSLNILVFPCGSAGKESACNMGDLGSIPGLGRSPGEWKGYPLQYSGLENSMDCIVHGVGNSQTRLSDFHFKHSSLFVLSVQVQRYTGGLLWSSLLISELFHVWPPLWRISHGQRGLPPAILVNKE